MILTSHNKKQLNEEKKREMGMNTNFFKKYRFTQILSRNRATAFDKISSKEWSQRLFYYKKGKE
jgi:hypothetical protein